MGRRLTVWFAAFFLRRGWLTPAETMAALSRSHKHRSSAWRWQVLNDAQARNQRKALHGGPPLPDEERIRLAAAGFVWDETAKDWVPNPAIWGKDAR